VFFRGDSCFPLSPADEGSNRISEDDQLMQILVLLGKQKEEDASFISKNRRYLESFKVPLNKVDFKEELPMTSSKLADILQRLL